MEGSARQNPLGLNGLLLPAFGWAAGENRGYRSAEHASLCAEQAKASALCEDGGEALHKRNRLRKRDILLFAAAAIAVLAGLYFGAQWLDDSGKNPEPQGDYHQRFSAETVTINGKQYRQKNNLTTILVMGVDQDSDAEVFNNNRNGGNADMMRLVVIDPTEKKVSQVAIDRDTMAPITILGMMGYRTGVRTTQICLAHAYGDGREKSCELTVEAVSNLFLNIPIKYYMAMNLDGIHVLNDSVGGITVTLEDDFSHIDPAMTKGTTLTLVGDQAETFVRSRKSMEVGTNEARMKRQETYLGKMTDALVEKIKSSNEYIGTLFDEMTPYLCTNMSRAKLVNEAWAARDYQRAPVVTLEGTRTENTKDNRMEFYVDETALEQVVLDLFYRETK